MKDFDKWNEIKKIVNETRSSINVKEGQVFWCKMGLNIGDEIFGKGIFFRRPILVLKKFSQNVFLGLPISSKKKIGSWYYYIKSHERTVILNQVRIIDRKRLEEKMFEISEKTLQEVRNAICDLIKS